MYSEDKALADPFFTSKEWDLEKSSLFDNVSSRKSSSATSCDEALDIPLLKERFAKPSNERAAIECQLKVFNDSLSKVEGTDFFEISSPETLKELLDLHHSAENSMPRSGEMFPFLHGSTALREKVFFDSRFDPASELQFLTEDSETISRRFPLDSFAKPAELAFHLMTVNSQADENPFLANSVEIEDMLMFKNVNGIPSSTEKLNLFHFKQFKDFDQTFDCPFRLLARSNRNYMLQITLMAPLSHFIVYSNEMDTDGNIDVARIIRYLQDLSSNKHIYVVNFSPRQWSKVGLYTTEYCKQNRSKKATTHRHERALPDRLSTLEQNLIWQTYSITQLFPRLYVGNTLDFKLLVLEKDTPSLHDFQLYIYCHWKARMPTVSLLRRILRDIDTGHTKTPIFLEFSDEMFRSTTVPSKKAVLCFLTFLRVVNLIVNRNKRKVFVYSYDGFTSTSAFLLSLGLLWGSDHIEEVALSLFRRPDVKFQLTFLEFQILKDLEIYIQWFKRQPARGITHLKDMSLDRIYSSYRPYLKVTDWFHNCDEVNFPDYIYEGLYLGTVCHASSRTVLSTLDITNIISIGERPRWYNALKCTFSHEATPSTKGPVIEPIYRFNNGRSFVYEVRTDSVDSLAQLFRHKAVPRLKSFIFIHGIEDDGRDSIYLLLVGCPDWVQRKLLVSPSKDSKTLVHCRVGVSRSATLTIASVMKNFRVSLVESFSYVRVRRLNVLIQPNLRLFYELFLYDEFLRSGCSDRKNGGAAPVCWWTLCAEIYRLNRQYIED